MGAEMGRHAVDVLRWAYGIHIDRHDVEVGQAAQQVDALARAQATPGGCADAGGAGRIEDIHVEAEIDRALADFVAELRHALGEAAADQLVHRDDLVAEAERARHDVLRVGRAADADMPGKFRVDQAFLGDMGELGGGVIFFVGAIGIGIGVRVDMERRHLRVFLADGSGHRDGDRAVAADGDGDGTGLDDAIDGLLGALEGIDDLRWRQFHVAAIDQAQCFDRIEIGIGGIEAAHQLRLLAHRIGTAARADAHVGAAIEGNAEDRRLVAGARAAVGRAHEGIGQGEEFGVGQLVHVHCSAERKS